MPTAQPPLAILLSHIADAQVGFAASGVHEIVRAAALTPLPGAPDIIEGALNLHGRILPVVDVRKRLGLPALGIAPGHFLIALESAGRLIAVRVDDVVDVVDVDMDDLASATSLSPTLARLRGVAATANGAIVIHDVDAFLTQAEHEALDQLATAPG
ncbi:MAG: cheW [Gemmatimonadetes bacterium]|nr:cheW [Gemmatimonadota bacterium]